MLKGDYEGLRKNRMICAESFKMAAIFTHTDIKEEDLLGGDEINMCVAMDQLFQRMINEGEGTLSSPLEKQLTETSLEKLNELTLNIFNINSEEGVLNLMN